MTDQQVEVWIARLLRSGVLLAALIVLGGGICFLAQHGEMAVHYHSFRSEPPQYTTAPAIVAGAMGGDCLAVIQLGLLVLIATPVARVAFSIAAFALERDWMYVLITAIVLAILLYSLI